MTSLAVTVTIACLLLAGAIGNDKDKAFIGGLGLLIAFGVVLYGLGALALAIYYYYFY